MFGWLRHNKNMTISPPHKSRDEKKFLALKKAIEEGIADIEAGRVSLGEDVFARLEKKFSCHSFYKT
jgi:hypothetical protein